MAKRFAIILLATIGGGALGLALGYLGLSGWFVTWKSIDQPPELVSKIIALSGPSVWVQTSTGVIYYNARSDECQRACWAVVAQVSSDQPRPGSVKEILPTTCVTPPPFFDALDQKGDCWRGFWQDYNTVYAIRRDGSVWVWHFVSGGEWGLFALLGATCLGALALLVLALGAIFIFGAFKRRPIGAPS